MKISRKLGLLIISIFVFILKIDVVSAKEITCEYEMYSVNYYVNDNETPVAVKGDTASSAKLKFNGTSKDDYTIKHEQSLGGKLTKSFKDNDFAKKVFKDQKCPTYVYVKIKTNDTIDAVSSTKFTSLQNSFYKSSSRAKKYPMFLTKENGKSTTTYATFSTILGVNNWVKIIQSGNTSSQDLAKQYYDVIYKNQSVYSKMVKQSNWTKFSDYALGDSNDNKTEKELNNLNSESVKANRDYCYYYCPKSACANTSGTAQSECLKSCEKNLKPKCESAYNACKNTKPSTEQAKCINTKFSENGLDTSYPAIRSQEMSELSKEIEKLKKSVETAKASKININVGTNTYKLKCDDVVIFHDIWVIIIIVAPALVIVMGTLDFGQAVISSNEDKMQKAWKRFPKRVFALVLLILIPLLISLLLSLTTDEGARDTSLMYCIINGGD